MSHVYINIMPSSLNTLEIKTRKIERLTTTYGQRDSNNNNEKESENKIVD